MGALIWGAIVGMIAYFTGDVKVALGVGLALGGLIFGGVNYLI